MNYQELKQAKESFDYFYIESEKQKSTLYSQRKDIVKNFNIKRISSMQLDEYVQGKGNKKSFCYRLEKELDQLGRMAGAPAIKFGVYYAKKKGEYVFAKKFGSTYEKAFEKVKESIFELLEAGKNKDYRSLVNNPISTMFKGKILSTYYPETYLNIFGDDHLKFFLKQLNLDTISLNKKDPIYKRKVLVEFKNRDKDMSRWSNDKFTEFLYYLFPHYPKNQNNKRNDVEGKEEIITFPTPVDISFVDLTINWRRPTPSNKKIKTNGELDYEKEARRNKKLGDRGEYIVRLKEVQRIQETFKISEEEAEMKIDWVSQKSDSYGYDIKSINDDGSSRYIEVKATKEACGNINFYYTANELKASEEYGNNYYIYIVYDIEKDHPKILVIQNPFKGENKLELIPIKYRVPLYVEPSKSK